MSRIIGIVAVCAVTSLARSINLVEANCNVEMPTLCDHSLEVCHCHCASLPLGLILCPNCVSAPGLLAVETSSLPAVKLST